MACVGRPDVESVQKYAQKITLRSDHIGSMRKSITGATMPLTRWISFPMENLSWILVQDKTTSQVPTPPIPMGG
jgi:hypothetical protein